jgi:hypothetical protein
VKRGGGALKDCVKATATRQRVYAEEPRKYLKINAPRPRGAWGERRTRETLSLAEPLGEGRPPILINGAADRR